MGECGCTGTSSNVRQGEARPASPPHTRPQTNYKGELLDLRRHLQQAPPQMNAASNSRNQRSTYNSSQALRWMIPDVLRSAHSFH